MQRYFRRSSRRASAIACACCARSSRRRSRSGCQVSSCSPWSRTRSGTASRRCAHGGTLRIAARVEAGDLVVEVSGQHRAAARRDPVLARDTGWTTCARGSGLYPAAVRSISAPAPAVTARWRASGCRFRQERRGGRAGRRRGGALMRVVIVEDERPARDRLRRLLRITRTASSSARPATPSPPPRSSIARSPTSASWTCRCRKGTGSRSCAASPTGRG